MTPSTQGIWATKLTFELLLISSCAPYYHRSCPTGPLLPLVRSLEGENQREPHQAERRKTHTNSVFSRGFDSPTRRFDRASTTPPPPPSYVYHPAELFPEPVFHLRVPSPPQSPPIRSSCPNPSTLPPSPPFHTIELPLFSVPLQSTCTEYNRIAHSHPLPASTIVSAIVSASVSASGTFFVEYDLVFQ